MHPIKFFLLLFSFSLFFVCRVKAQDRYKIEITVCDSLTRQPLTNASVYIPKTNTTATTNKQGQAIFYLQPENYTVFVHYPEDKPNSFRLKLQQDTIINVFMSSQFKHYLISEVEVTGNHYNKSENVYSGLERVKPLTIKTFPSLMGEKDVVKTLSSLPGVAQGSDGSADIFVRGGTTDQNLFLIDENTIYSPSHLFGFFSSVVPEIVKEVDFYKGSFPVNYGGKLSSVIDIETKDPLLDTFNVNLELSALSAKLVVEAPIVKDKTGILFSARATHYDQFIKKFLLSDEDYSVAGFYDFFGKISHKINSKSHVMIDAYFDRDYYLQGSKATDYEGSDNVKWKNQFVSAKYRHQLSARSSFSATAGWTKYKMQITEKTLLKDSTQNCIKDFNSYIDDKYLKLLFDKKSGKQLNLLVGADYTIHDILPASTLSTYFDTAYSHTIIPSQIFHEASAFVSNIFTPWPKLKIQAGARLNAMVDKSSFWFSFDPRMNLQYSFNNENSVKVAYTKVSQAIHLLTNPGLGMPLNIHIPFSDNYKPEYAHQFSVATNLQKELGGRLFYFTAEAYYKQMKNIVSYLPGTSSRNFTAFAISTKDLDEIVTTGKGKSYGLELMVEKPFGKLNGRVAYTLSGIKHQFDELNDGKAFYAQHHRPHNLTMVASYDFNKKHTFSANFNFMSGGRVTLPIYLYNQYYFGIADDYTFEYAYGGIPTYAQSEINAYKMMDSHTLNLSYIYKFQHLKWKGEWELSVYNVYNRKNPYYYYMDIHSELIRNEDNIWDSEVITKPALVCVSLFGIIPSLTFRVNF